MIGQHSFPGSDPRQNTFPAAGKSCKKVRLNKSFRHQKITVHRQRIHRQFPAGRQDTDLRHGRSVPGIVDHDLFILNDIFAEFLHQFLTGGLPVNAGGDQQSDLHLRIACPQFRQHGRNNEFTGDWTGMVTADNNTGFGVFSQCFQPGGPDGVCHSPENFNSLIRHRRSTLRHKIAEMVLFINTELCQRIVAGNMNRYHSSAASISTPPKKELPGKNGFPVEISPGCNIAQKNQITSFLRLATHKNIRY